MLSLNVMLTNGTPLQIRTGTEGSLSPLPLPIGLVGQIGTPGGNRTRYRHSTTRLKVWRPAISRRVLNNYHDKHTPSEGNIASEDNDWLYRTHS